MTLDMNKWVSRPEDIFQIIDDFSSFMSLTLKISELHGNIFKLILKNKGKKENWQRENLQWGLCSVPPVQYLLAQRIHLKQVQQPENVMRIHSVLKSWNVKLEKARTWVSYKIFTVITAAMK